MLLLLSGVLCLQACEKGRGGGAILQGCALYLTLLCGLKGMANVFQLVYFCSYRPSIAISVKSFLFCCLIACQSVALVLPTLFFSFSFFLFIFLFGVWTLFQAVYTYSVGCQLYDCIESEGWLSSLMSYVVLVEFMSICTLYLSFLFYLFYF